MPRGGSRPGAGRKAATTVRYQERMRAVVERMVTENVFEDIVKKAIAQAKNGNPIARAWLTPWVLGASPKPVEPPAEDKPSLVDDLE